MEAIMIAFRFFHVCRFLIFSFLFHYFVPDASAQIATHVVLSEVYGGGGNSGALYKSDFIELYNPTSTPVIMTNWSVQYASAGGNYTSGNKTTFSGTIPSHRFFLIQEAVGSGGTLDLPSPDVVGTVALSATNGKIALVDDTITIAGPSGGNVVDFIGFGTANQYEGSAAAPAPSNTTSIERKAQASSSTSSMAFGGTDSLQGNGWDSQDNSQDIVVRTHPNPQNSGSPAETPPASFLVIQNINHSPFTPDLNGTDTVTANVLGSVPSAVRLHIIVNSGPVDSSVAMIPVAGGLYRGIISSSKHTANGQMVEFFVSAVDSHGQYVSSMNSLKGYFVGITSIITIKSHSLAAIAGYGVRISGALSVNTNIFAQGEGYIQDASGGLQMYLSGGLPVFNNGRNIKLQGSIVNYNDGYEIADPGFKLLDTALGTSVLAPVAISLPLAEGPSNSSDGMLVKIANLSSSTGGSFSPGNYLLHSPAGDTITIAVESNGALNTLIGTPVPTNPVEATGILSYATGFLRLKPRAAEDMGNLPVTTFEAVTSGRWSDSATWSVHRVPAQSDHVSVSTPGVIVTLDLPDAQCNNLTMTGSGSTGGPTLRFDSTGTRSLTVNGSLSISGGSGSGQGGRPKLTSNGNVNAVLVVKHNILTTSSNSTSSGSAGLNMNEGTVRLTGSSSDTLKNGAGLRLGNLQIGDGAVPKILVWAPSKSSTLVLRSLLVKNMAAFLIGSPDDTIADDIGNASMSGVPALSGGIVVEHGGSVLVQNSHSGNSTASINLAGGGIRNDGTIILDSVTSSYVMHSSAAPQEVFRSSYTLNVAGYPASSGSSQIISGTSPLHCGSIVVGKNDTLGLQQQILLAPDATMVLSGTLHESSRCTVLGTLFATRAVSQGIRETFGGIGCAVTASGTAPDTTTVRRVTGVASIGELGSSSILRYFEFTPKFNTNLNASVDFSYDVSEMAGQDPSKLVAWCSDDSGSHWYNTGLSWQNDTSVRVLHVSFIQSLARLTAADVFHPLGITTVTQQFPLSKGWNMVSLPFHVADQTKKFLFPAAISPAFRYIGLYTISDTLENCIGYWMKFPGDTTCELTGYLRSQDTILLSDGWNLIGTLSEDIPSNYITEVPSGIVVSQYFGYNGGYAVAETLAVCKGYWVKSNGAGRLVLSSRPPAKAKSSLSIPSSGLMTSLQFVDGKNNHQTLFLDSREMSEVDSRNAGLPPIPPDTLFDVRFASQRFIESFNCSHDSIKKYPFRIRTRSYPVTIRWKQNENNVCMTIVGPGGRSWPLTASAGTIVVDESSAGNLVLVVTKGVSRYEGYALSLNYPNPFNPSTSFSLTIPANAKVDVSVYDVSGRKIKTVISRVLSRGEHKVTWDGSTDRGEPAMSGIYFVRMNAGSFSAVRKVVLVR
jgi:hypothetical protein